MRKQWIRALVCAAALSGMGCGVDEPPERHHNGLASIDEAAIEARLDGSTVELQIPVAKITSGLLQGSLTVDLLDARDVDAEPLGSGSVALTQSEELEIHDLVIDTELEGLERAETAPLIVRWRLSNDESALYGRRSLYAALGNIDVELRVPSEFSAEGDSAVRVIAVDPQTGEAIEDAQVKLELALTEDGEETLRELATGQTDERGEYSELIAIDADIEAASIVVTVTSDNAQVTTRRTVSQRDQSQLYLSSDKTLYKPGQSVHLRLLALDGAERMPRAEEEVVFEARDGRGNKVFTRTTATDGFGVAHIDVPIDTRVNEGDWRFEAIIDGKTQRLVLPVEKYNLPRMRVEVAQPRPYALIGETVRGRVNASYLFGEPVVGASVNVQVSSGLGLVSEFISGETDAQGGFDYEFTLSDTAPGNLDDLGDVVSISTEIVDTAGQRETGAASLAVAAAPLTISLTSSDLADGTRSFVRVTDPLGRPVRASVTLSGDVDLSGETDSNGLFALESVREDAVLAFEVDVEDGAGRSHSRQFELQAAEERAIALVASRSVVSPGEVAELTVVSDTFERVHLDVYAGATVLSSAAVDLSEGQAALSIPIPESARGVLVVEATVGRGTSRAKATTPLLIARDDGLRVELETEETYRPGEEAEVGIRVTDAEGRPQVASLGMTIVDEAVFVLGGEPSVKLSSITGIDQRVFGNAATPIDPNRVVSMPEQERERAAAFLQAGVGPLATTGADYNSLSAEIPIVENSVRGLIDRDLQSLLNGLRGAIDDGLITERNFAEVVTGKPLVDPFGVAYAVEAEDTRVTLRSFGPDEREGTWDDVQSSADAFRIFNDWDDDGDGLRGAVPEAQAGNAPPPQDDGDQDTGGGQDGAVKVRSDFRETALVAPTLITDREGRASVTLHLPHSITTWRASVDGSSQNGRFGEARGHLRTFQPFFVDFQMPTELTVGDTLTLPAIVYNYTDEEQSIRVSLADADWLEVSGSPSQQVVLGPSEVRAARFEVTVLRAGSRSLEIRGEGDGLADALVRVAHVSPEGVAEDQSFSGQLEGSALHTVTIPQDVTDGGVYVALSVTPGFAAEAVEGLEGMVKEPNGCFEQTTSTAWPNTMVANYLEATGQMTEEKREEIVGTVTRGYQRLLTFESPTGGFNWWGDADPGNRILSAIMLWHLKDLETLIETDEEVRARTVQWLVEQQNADGSWDAGDALHSGNESLGTNIARSTSFVAWALAHTGWAEDAVARAANYLSSNAPDEGDLYANALAANAMVMADLGNPMTTELLNRLDSMKEQRELNITWPTGAPSWTGASGDMAAIETTGLVAYGMMKADAFPSDVEGAMRYIVSSKDSVGTWYNTQATMNALRALSAAAAVEESDARGTVTVRVNDEVVETFEVTDANAELLRTFDISEHFRLGDNDVRVSMDGTDGLTYRLARVAHRPAPAAAEGGLSMEIEHSATEVSVGEPVGCTVRTHNGEETEQNQVMVRVGRAPGFTPMSEDLQALVDRGLVSRFEIRASDVTFYLMAVAPGETRELTFRTIPGLVAEVTAPSSEIYSYYQTDRKQTLPPMTFTVTD